MRTKILILSIVLIFSVSVFSAPQKSEDAKQWEEEYLRLTKEYKQVSQLLNPDYTKLAELREQRERTLMTIPSDFGTEKIQALKKEYMRLKIEYEEMSEIYKPTYPKLEQLQKEIFQTRERLITEIDNVLGEQVKSTK
jgi:uncharacterized protein involved in exopolysaccharide biosynthesis